MLQQFDFGPIVAKQADELRACAAKRNPDNLVKELTLPRRMAFKLAFKKENAGEDKEVFDKAYKYLNSK